MNKREQKILKTIEEFYKKLPKFPDGRIDYSNSDTAPVVTVFLKYKDKILLLKRSEKVLTYKGKWNAIAGYLDDLKPIQEKVKEEIKEELGIEKDIVSSVFIGESYKFRDEKINKTWIVFPVMVELKNEPKVKLDWEHTESRWIKPEELASFNTIPHFNQSLKKVI
jgi:isopentenyldiphosphate isomerase